MNDGRKDPIGCLHFEYFFEISIDMFCIAGVDGFFKRVSPAFERTLGFTEAELLARPFLEFVHPDDRERTLAEVNLLDNGVHAVYFENRYRCRDGSWKWLAWTCPAATPGDGYLYAIARDITDMKLQQTQLVHLARYDSLTGLNNRAVFLDEVARAVAMSRRSGAVIAVLLLDLDGLKPVNDELGHNAGDAVLCEIAARLGENTRKSDMVARMGGDEFAILLQGGPMNAEVVARRILKAVARPLYKLDGTFRGCYEL